ncbi:hypothetical protein BIV57_19980 [Mangrovactinospora gilvigrisea]|uniref:HTH cro/C1-type domain-containing protein n=1 Tax=Mangrovactinospora gilvigrisea TaxID=1428644 RepID=A0A1J7C7Y8_9ACTN|nr:helix-turn-helix transcriptional regulator [Mangrovactinospora gilvigrisea]OIV35754.1 hypothetical protein BIV57_19980 [Mangrovactinospora gilvigrisea]
MPEATGSFGRELRERRVRAGLSLQGLADLVHYSKGQLSKVERGRQRPSRELAGLCDERLGAGGALVRLAADGTAGEGIDMDRDRRQLMVAGIAAALAPGNELVAFPQLLPHLAPPRPVDGRAGGGAFLESSRALLLGLRAMGQVSAPAQVIPTAAAHARTLLLATADASGRDRAELLRLASRFTEYVGWLAQEQGDDRTALAWTARAVELARAAGDRDLAAYALIRDALVALYRNDAARTVAAARRAQADGVPVHICRQAAQREAQGHALAGDAAAALDCLDRARDLTEHPAGRASEPVLGSMHVPDPVAAATGWCLYDLGRPAEAAAILDAQTAAMPGAALRARARFGVRAALAHAAAGEVERACAGVAPLLPTLAATGSATVAVDVRALARTLARHPRNAEVRRLLPELTTLHLP